MNDLINLFSITPMSEDLFYYWKENLETDPVRRGKWIREKLLAGTIPDVPITVDKD